MAKYSIWNKKDDVYVPTGARFTARQWIEKHPIAEIETVAVVHSGGTINGAFFGILSDMAERCRQMGCSFEGCTTDEEILSKIEEFEASLNAPKESTEPTAEERTAAALEFIALSSLPDETV